MRLANPRKGNNGSISPVCRGGNNNTRERYMNEIHEIKGKKYILMEAEDRCRGCAFDNGDDFNPTKECAEAPECWNSEGVDVIFVEVTE